MTISPHMLSVQTLAAGAQRLPAGIPASKLPGPSYPPPPMVQSGLLYTRTAEKTPYCLLATDWPIFHCTHTCVLSLTPRFITARVTRKIINTPPPPFLGRPNFPKSEFSRQRGGACKRPDKCRVNGNPVAYVFPKPPLRRVAVGDYKYTNHCLEI